MRIGIIGAGHNGLVCAYYLAKAGHSVTMFEQRDTIGGLCVTEELFPGYKVSSVASYYGMLRQEILADLELTRFGLEPYLTNPVEIVLLPEGKFVYTPRDGSDSRIEIGELSQADLSGWKQFWHDIATAARLISPHYLQSNVTQDYLQKLLFEFDLPVLAQNLFQGSLLSTLESYITNKYLMTIAATCTPGFANQKGSLLGCIHHGTANTGGEEGAWGMVKGGMGSITQAMLKAVTSLGVEVISKKAVKHLKVNKGHIEEILFADGSKASFDLVISNADPYTTFNLITPGNELPESIQTRLQAPVSSLSAGKVHFALKSLPPFPLLEKIGHNYAGIIVITPYLEDIISASTQLAKGHLPEHLMLTMAFPSVTDGSIAPPGKHLLNVDFHYLPTTYNGKNWTEQNKTAILDATIKILEKHCPSFRNYIEDSVVISPCDLATTYGVSTMSCWHLPMSHEFLAEKRAFPNCKDHSTPYTNLFLCGAGTFPGGNVTGAPGHNCAQEILEVTK